MPEAAEEWRNVLRELHELSSHMSELRIELRGFSRDLETVTKIVRGNGTPSLETSLALVVQNVQHLDARVIANTEALQEAKVEKYKVWAALITGVISFAAAVVAAAAAFLRR